MAIDCGMSRRLRGDQQSAIAPEAETILAAACPRERAKGLTPANRGDDIRPGDPRPPAEGGPAGMSFVPSDLRVAGHLTEQMRAFLRRAGLGSWPVFVSFGDPGVAAERDLEAIAAACGGWEPHPAAGNGGEQPGVLANQSDTHACSLAPAGFLRLPSHGVVLGRWYRFDARNPQGWSALHLAAARGLCLVPPASRRPAGPTRGTCGGYRRRAVGGRALQPPPIDTRDPLVLRLDIRRRYA
jgi:hypothetical protein